MLRHRIYYNISQLFKINPAMVLPVLLLPIGIVYSVKIPAQPSTPIQFNAISTNTGVQITFTWSKPTRTSYQHHDTELLITFSKPLGQLSLTELVPRYRQWITNVEYGYDSVLFTFSWTTSASVKTTQTSLTVDLTQPPHRLDDNEANEDQLDYLRALASLQAGEPRQARHILMRLTQKRPNNMTYMRHLALSEQRIGAWREAQQRYTDMLIRNPDASDIAQAKDQLMREHGNQIRIDTTWRIADLSDQQTLTKFNARLLLSNHSRLQAHITRRKIQRLNIQSALNQENQYTRDFAKIGFTYGHELQEQTITLLSGTSTLGASYQYTRGPLAKRFKLVIKANHPVTNYLEGLLNQSVQHGFLLQWHLSNVQRSSLIRLLGHQFRTAATQSIADTVGLQGRFRYTVLKTPLMLTVGYSLDAEYITKTMPAPLNDKQISTELPITDREVHALHVEINHQLSRHFNYGVNAGYALDRFHSQAPFVYLSARYMINRRLETGMNTYRSIAFERGSSHQVKQLTWYITGYLL